MFLLALKNILFFKARSITTFILTFISTLFFILYVSLVDGSHDSMLLNALKIYTGAIEIYKKNYRDIGGNEYFITNVKNIKEKIKNIDGIKSLTSRYETYGLLSYKKNSSAAMVAGINPDEEIKASKLKAALVKGEYLSNEQNNCLYAGYDLVKKLKVKIGDELAFIGSASDNSFASDMFKLCGIFKTGSFKFDATSSFLNRTYFDKLMYSQNKASYINIQVDDLSMVDKINEKIQKVISFEYETLTWKILMKSMVAMMQVDSIFSYISISLFFVVIFFVLMIFSFINVSSRVKEFGILRCIGLSKENIRMLLFYEIFIISCVAFLIATPLGAYIAYYFSINPIIIEGMSEMYKEYAIVSDSIFLKFNLYTIGWNVVLILVINLLSIVYPVRYINAFKPIEATCHV